MSGMAFPYRFGADGRTLQPGPEERLRDLVEMLLFTRPGERVMRPTLGTPVAALLFEGLNDALAAALHTSIHAALQQWLADELVVAEVDVESDGTALLVTVAYRDPHESTLRRIEFRRERP